MFTLQVKSVHPSLNPNALLKWSEPNFKDLCQNAHLAFCHFNNDNILFSGESVAVVVNISNQSSSKLKPKIKLQERKEYRAGSSVTACNQTLGKAVGDTINGNSEGTVTCQIPIPGGIIPTIRNCEILSVDYCLKVRKNKKITVNNHATCHYYVQACMV